MRLCNIKDVSMSMVTMLGTFRGYIHLVALELDKHLAMILLSDGIEPIGPDGMNLMVFRPWSSRLT